MIKTVAVIGAGSAGQLFARRCLETGLAVVLEDVMPAALRSARQALEPVVAGKRDQSLRTVLTVEDAVRDADLAIDFVPDELESKLEIFSMVDRMAPPRTILCTPTDVLSITDLASCTYRPERCLGVRGLEQALRGARRPVDLISSAATDVAVQLAVEQMLMRLIVEVRSVPDRDVPQLTRNG